MSTMGGGDGTNPYHISPISARLSFILEADPDQQLPLMYCIAGESRIVLIDTGCASGDLKAIVEVRCLLYCKVWGIEVMHRLFCTTHISRPKITFRVVMRSQVYMQHGAERQRFHKKIPSSLRASSFKSRLYEFSYMRYHHPVLFPGTSC